MVFELPIFIKIKCLPCEKVPGSIDAILFWLKSIEIFAVLKLENLNAPKGIDVMTFLDKLMFKTVADGKLKAPEAIVDILFAVELKVIDFAAGKFKSPDEINVIWFPFNQILIVVADEELKIPLGIVASLLLRKSSEIVVADENVNALGEMTSADR